MPKRLPGAKMPSHMTRAPPSEPSRRRLLTAGGVSAAAALGLSGCASVSTPGEAKERPGDDLAVLISLIGLEHQAIAAYEAVLATRLLGDGEAEQAGAFLLDHRRHVERLGHALEQVGGALAKEEAAPSPASVTLADRGEALRYLVGVERGLALAHLGAVPAYGHRELADMFGESSCDEWIFFAAPAEALFPQRPRVRLRLAQRQFVFSR